MSDNWLEQVYEERKQELFRFLYVILGEQQAAEDALQETFLKAYLGQYKFGELYTGLVVKQGTTYLEAFRDKVYHPMSASYYDAFQVSHVDISVFL